MKFLILATVLLVSFAFANVTEGIESSEVSNDIILNATEGSVWYGPLAELFNTGPWFNSPGTGSGGADESVLEEWGTTYGFGCQVYYENLVADDFEVPAGETWEINSVTVAGYQTGSGLTPTLTAVYLQVYDDDPNFGAVVFGDITEDVFTSAVWSNIYRVNYDTGGATNRPIMAVTADLATPWTVAEGTYWLAFQLDGTGSSGPWTPPVVIMGTQVTGNGMQSVDGGILWEPVDSGGYAQGMLFILEGEIVGALEQSTWGAIKTTF